MMNVQFGDSGIPTFRLLVSASDSLTGQQPYAGWFLTLVRHSTGQPFSVEGGRDPKK